MNFLSQLLYPVSFRPRRRMADFDVYMTIEEKGDDELVITEQPVQYGAEITDHAYKKNASLSMRVQFNEADTGTSLDEIYRRMLELQNSRVPFEVVTGKRLYKNMLFQSLSQTTDRNTDNVLSISVQLKEIRTVTVEVVSVPPRDKQAQAGRTGATENAGQKKAKPVPPQDQEKKKSALKSLAGSIG